MKLVLDSNIVLDYLMMREPFYASARKLMILGYLKEHELWFSSAQINDIFYILAGGGKRSAAADVVRDMKRLRLGVRVCGISEVDIDAVLESSWVDLEDACVHQAALKLKADAIITRNKKDFSKSSIKVFDCDEFFTYLEEEYNVVYEEIPF